MGSVIATANAVLAAAAALVTARSLRTHLFRGAEFTVRVLKALLAMAYCVLVLVDSWSSDDWSLWRQGLGLVAFPVVWIVPEILTMRSRRSVVRTLESWTGEE